MPRRIRFVPPGSLVEVTCRTVQGRLLLRPSPLLRDLTLGVLARSVRLYPVEIHAFVFLSNHFHLLLTVPDARRLAEFMGYLNSNLAREAGRLVGWREKFWGRRYQAILISPEEGAQIARLRYLLSHGSKEGLVRSPREWPGAHGVDALLTGEHVVGRWIDRTFESHARSKGIALSPTDSAQLEVLALAPVPCWRHLLPAVYRQRMEELVTSIEAEAVARCRNRNPPRSGHRIQAIEAVNPHQEWSRIRRRPAPLVHAISKRIQREFADAYRLFVLAYRRAAGQLRLGVLDARFPVGSFPPGLPFTEAPQAS